MIMMIMMICKVAMLEVYMQYYNVLFFVFCVECACQITIPLKDMEEFENETVVFALSLSKPRVVEWLKNSQAIPEDERVKKYASKDGLKHALTIINITLEDKGVYTSRIDDLEYGFMESSGSLLVKGFVVVSLHSFFAVPYFLYEQLPFA